MRIFSKKALAFHDPKGQEREVTVRAKEFADVPDWVKGSTMFKLAAKDDDVTVIDDKKAEKKAEKAAADGNTKGGPSMTKEEAEAKANETK